MFGSLLYKWKSFNLSETPSILCEMCDCNLNNSPGKTFMCVKRTMGWSEMSFYLCILLKPTQFHTKWYPWSDKTLLRLLSSSGIYGPDKGWTSVYPECRERNQSPINIVDQDTKVSPEYQELTLEGFDIESSNKTSMKNTGKTGNTNTSSCCTLDSLWFVASGFFGR